VDKCNSELCDILQVSGVDLQYFGSNEDSMNPLQLVEFNIRPVGVGHSASGFSVGICKTDMMQCARCRRFCCTPGEVLCNRCLPVMKGLLQKTSQKEISAASRSHPDNPKKKVKN